MSNNEHTDAGDTAYWSADPRVTAAFLSYQAMTKDVAAKRKALGDEAQRGVMVRRDGFGHGTRVVGFARLDTDRSGDRIDTLGERGLVVSSMRGANNGLIVPYTRIKIGKAIQARMNECRNPGPDLPGMPDFHIYGGGFGMVSGTPALWLWEGTVYALWGTDSAPVDPMLWEQIPLSQYHKAREDHEAAQAAEQEQSA